MAGCGVVVERCVQGTFLRGVNTTSWRIRDESKWGVRADLTPCSDVMSIDFIHLVAARHSSRSSTVIE